MKKPDAALFKLSELGFITQCTGEFTCVQEWIHSWTHVILKGTEGKHEFEWKDIKKYLEYDINHCSIMRIKRKYENELNAWSVYEARNRKELTEFKRPKKKFGEV